MIEIIKQKISGRRMNKKAFLARTWVIALLLFSAVFALMFLASSDLLTDYDADRYIDEGYREHYDKYTNASEDVGEMFEIARSDEGLSLLGAAVGLFSAVVSIIKITFGSLAIMGEQATNFATDFGVPTAIAGIFFPLIIAVMTVVLIFVLISAVNRGNKI